MTESASPAATPEGAGTGAPEPAGTPAAPVPAPPTAKPSPAAKAKPPAPEDRPFTEFVPQLLLPAFSKEVEAYGGPAPELAFEQGPMPVVGSESWIVKGSLPGERRFWLCFTAPDINAAKTLCLAEGGGAPTLLESFLIDEKKMSLALIVSRLVQRLNCQKWLGPN